MPATRATVGLALLATTSVALLACASSSPPAAQEAPAPADEARTAQSAVFDHHDRDPSTFWGDAGAVTHVGSKHCHTYPELVVLVDDARVVYDAVEKAPNCEMGDTARSIDVGSEQSFRGVVGALLLIAEDGGSGIYDLSLYDATTGAEVFTARDVPPASRTRVDTAKRQLIYGVGVAFPDYCAKGHETYAAQEEACWAEIQRQHPILAITPAPGCDCGPGGLWPFPILHRSVSLDALGDAPVEVMPLICGCSS